MAASSRQQVVIDAPVERVWELVGDPNHHAAWWPKVVESECEEIEEGCRFRRVEKVLGIEEENEFTIERLDDCHEITIYCADHGFRNRFLLTEAQGSTFVDAEFHSDPQQLGRRLLGAAGGNRFMRRWLEQSLEGLKGVAERVAGAAST